MTPTGATRSTRMKFRVGMRTQAAPAVKTRRQATVFDRVFGCFGYAPRLTLVVASVALFVLVPAAQAFAEEAHLKLNVVGSGSGEIISQANSEVGLGFGTPPIACSYDGTSMKGACENVPDLLGEEEGFYAEELQALPATGSEFVGWTVRNGAAGKCPIKGAGEGRLCLLFGEDGEGIEWEITAEFAVGSKPSFKLNLGASGTGSGTFECKVSGGSEEACKAEYEEGKIVEVVQHAAVGSEFANWTGDCTGSGACTLTMSAEHSVGGVFNLASLKSYKLNLNMSGTGSGTFKCKVNGGSEEACNPEYEEGATVEVVPHAVVGSEFVNWTGDCVGSGPCVLSMTAERSVDGVFNNEPTHPAVLSVFRSGSGTGTVSSPAGISCVSEPCEGVFEEGDVITLEAHPAPGSVFAGWLGCRHVTPTTCQVKLGSPEVEVTAIFLIEGKEGTNGKEGKEGPEGKAGKEGATGKEGTAGKEGPEGKAGKEGSRGEIGFLGPEGSQGQAGQTGSQGVQGVQGAPGAQGAQGLAGIPGAMGPQGKQGPAGPAAKVSCKVKQQKNGNKVKVTCTVAYQGVTASASTAGVRWSLTHNGHTVRRGITSHGRLTVGYVHNGRYRLHIQGQKGSRLIVVG